VTLTLFFSLEADFPAKGSKDDEGIFRFPDEIEIESDRGCFSNAV
jgi:hypothetical protein